MRDWEPPADADDDRPILADSPAPTSTSFDEAQTAVGLPDEPPRRRRDPRREEDDDQVDTDRHPRLPRLPGVTEGAAATASPRREGRRAERPRREGRGDEPRPNPDVPSDPNLSNIFLNVGRRDGVNPEGLQRLLADSAGIPASETGNIRVRDRITFVTLRKELAERAIRALAGQVVGGRTVVAEPARDKA